MNRLTRTTINVPLLVPVLLIAVLLLGYNAVANQQDTKRPAVVATVDLERLFENLNERAAEDARLQAMATNIEQEAEKRRNKIRGLDEELKIHPAGSEKAQQIQDELAMESIQYQAWIEFQRQSLEREKGLVMMKIYRSIKRSVQEMSEANGYDIVLLNDSLKDLQRGPEQGVVQQISARRMLYTNPTLDITNALLARMNNAFSTTPQ